MGIYTLMKQPLNVEMAPFVVWCLVIDSKYQQPVTLQHWEMIWNTNTHLVSLHPLPHPHPLQKNSLAYAAKYSLKAVGSLLWALWRKLPVV